MTSNTLFCSSWDKSDQYPLSLIKLGPNIGTAQALRNILEANAPNLFYSKGKIPVIEFQKDESAEVVRREIVSEDQLLSWLAVPGSNIAGDDNFSNDRRGSSGGPGVTSPVVANSSVPRRLSEENTSSSIPASLSSSSSPAAKSPSSTVRCTFVFFQAPSSEAHLDVTLEMASKILTYFQVMPSYIEFMSVFTVVFGHQVEAVELRFSGFRERVLLSHSARGLNLEELALSGRNYQLCYNIKCVARKYPHSKKENWLWSARQASIHHQFDMAEGTSLWIMTAARSELQKRVNTLTGAEGRPEDKCFSTPAKSFIASLSVHLLLAQWGTEDWRGYIRWLEQVLEEKTIYALRTSDFIPSAEDISFVQKKEDETNKAIMMLEANADILGSLERFYRGLMANTDFELRRNAECKRAVSEFILQIQAFRHEFKMHSARAKTLGKITADRKNLVQQHLQAHSTEQMKLLTEQAQREAINMRVIAIMTFTLLPATFVSTFFSTDVVKYQGVGTQDGISTESYSPLALQRWFQVVIPLTVVTFAFAGCLLFWKHVKTCVARLGKSLLTCFRRMSSSRNRRISSGPCC
ncbi:hypothetical protein B0J14DRAFT_611404 [Halenospora varia]|nr:hypothetical protein B0J14DRAFT_611404 [Halenospora varia]